MAGPRVAAARAPPPRDRPLPRGPHPPLSAPELLPERRVARGPLDPGGAEGEDALRVPPVVHVEEVPRAAVVVVGARPAEGSEKGGRPLPGLGVLPPVGPRHVRHAIQGAGTPALGRRSSRVGPARPSPRAAGGLVPSPRDPGSTTKVPPPKSR